MGFSNIHYVRIQNPFLENFGKQEKCCFFLIDCLVISIRRVTGGVQGGGFLWDPTFLSKNICRN